MKIELHCIRAIIIGTCFTIYGVKALQGRGSEKKFVGLMIEVIFNKLWVAKYTIPGFEDALN